MGQKVSFNVKGSRDDRRRVFGRSSSSGEEEKAITASLWLLFEGSKVVIAEGADFLGLANWGAGMVGICGSSSSEEMQITSLSFAAGTIYYKSASLQGM